jgi:hypothetical protein
MVTKQILCCCLALLFVTGAGCTDITEYDMAFSAGLHVVSAQDFVITGTVSGIKGARSMLLNSGSVFIMSTEGIVYRYNLETLELTDQKQIGTPSPAGYSDAVLCTLKNTAYVTGAHGDILELSMPGCTVVDQFSVCQSPVMLALGHNSEYLFIADGPSNRIFQVIVDGNRRGADICVYYTIRHMAPAQNPDTMLVATADGINVISVPSSSSMRNRRTIEGFPFASMVAVPDDTVFVGVNSNSVGILDVFRGSATPPSPFYYGTARFSGTPFCAAVSSDLKCAYVLVYLAESNTSRLVSYDYCHMQIGRVLDIPGYPLDLKVSESEAVYVLTTE